MKIKPYEHKFGKPVPKLISFGIYKGFRSVTYGDYIWGEYKDVNIKIYHNKVDNTKLYYVSDKFNHWIKSKLVYFEKGIKKILRSQAK